MAAILLGWEPERWNIWEPDYPTAVNVAAETGCFHSRWPVEPHHHIAHSTEAWLLTQGSQQGILGHGTVISAPYEYLHDAAPGTASRYIDVVFDVLLPQGEQIRPEVLAQRVPDVDWGSVHQDISTLPVCEEGTLRAVWAGHMRTSEADPTAPVPGTCPAESTTRVLANRYERNTQARRECVAHYGTSCAACGFSFEMVYGEQGRGFISVHHIVPASQLGPDYKLDPLTDLVPLCPNCHAMAHRGQTTDPLTPAELRRIISQSGHLEGSAVSERELRALDDAARILGPDR